MNLKKLINSKFGKIIFSFLLGLGVVTFFRRSCEGKNCIVFRPPKSDEVSKTVYKYGDKCYKFKSHATPCDRNKKTVEY
jgi:hypothetical protein